MEDKRIETEVISDGVIRAEDIVVGSIHVDKILPGVLSPESVEKFRLGGDAP